VYERPVPESATGKTLIGVLIIAYGLFSLYRHGRYLIGAREGETTVGRSTRLFGVLGGGGLTAVGIWLIIQAQS
jgi:hypothetical protein